MGACCCCFSKRTEDPAASEELEHVPLSSQNAPVPAFSSLLLVDTNLDTSIPDTYRPPPIPMPYDTTLEHPRLSLVSQATEGDRNDTDTQTKNSGSPQETAGAHAQEPSEMSVNINECNSKLKTGQEIEISKSVEPIVVDFEEDSCPICLEEYDKENPKLITKCDHYFHLACILEWMERSNSCPVCDQEMIFDPPIN